MRACCMTYIKPHSLCLLINAWNRKYGLFTNGKLLVVSDKVSFLTAKPMVVNATPVRMSVPIVPAAQTVKQVSSVCAFCFNFLWVSKELCVKLLNRNSWFFTYVLIYLKSLKTFTQSALTSFRRLRFCLQWRYHCFRSCRWRQNQSTQLHR